MKPFASYSRSFKLNFKPKNRFSEKCSLVLPLNEEIFEATISGSFLQVHKKTFYFTYSQTILTQVLKKKVKKILIISRVVQCSKFYFLVVQTPNGQTQKLDEVEDYR